ncbi:MAG: 2-isopropylmalate synthase [Candidatus Omnitrophota bacterium]
MNGFTFSTIGEALKNMAIGAVIEAIRKGQRVLISDTTLGDGEQAPGSSLNPQQKLAIAKQLDKLGVDTIEAGFPGSSELEYEGVELVAKNIKRPTISVLSRCMKSDIDAAVQSLEKAKNWGLALFIGTSPKLRQFSLDNKSQDEIIETLTDAIKYAKKYTDSIAFGAEDATRTEPEFLYRVYEAAIDSGAVVIGVPDTVGWLIPEETASLMEKIKQNVPNIKKALIGVHFHNDLGLAVANTLTAIRHGANIVQCTINGIGERAGNTSLEEFVMALKTREDVYNIKTNVNTKELYATSKLVAEHTGMHVAPNKAVVGDNVFATEAGMHQVALLKERSTYEIIAPEEVGQLDTTLFLGRHSGKHMVLYKLNEAGIKLDDVKDQKKIDLIYQKFKELALTKKKVEDEELINIARAVI